MKIIRDSYFYSLFANVSLYWHNHNIILNDQTKVSMKLGVLVYVVPAMTRSCCFRFSTISEKCLWIKRKCSSTTSHKIKVPKRHSQSFVTLVKRACKIQLEFSEWKFELNISLYARHKAHVEIYYVAVIA